MQIIDRRLIGQIDWTLIAVTLMLAAIGLATIYSATYTQGFYIYNKHISWLIIGGLFFLIALILDYNMLNRYGYVIYGFSIFMLVYVLVLGHEIAGTYRWISLGFIRFQPSEFAKLALIVALAKHFSTKNITSKGLTIKDLIKPAILLIVPFLLVAKEPDLGTALVFALIFASMILVIKVNTKTLIYSILAFSPIFPLAWMSLKTYQKARLLSFLSPSSNTLGQGYHLLQSKIAIGSGGFLGKGYTNGTQGTLRFLPEHHTDFIFPIFAEEWGFLGSFILIMLFIMLILRGLNAAGLSKDRFGFLVALGISIMFFWHAIINLAMVCGLMPVVGMPLPFLSYGGSFLIASLIGIGILVNIGMRRFIF
ncbi:MAG: rod shape-determining protein RodA [Proteobacteria bacterium]|nr:rod shape-determining protein RodA [Pseudomonadota bacterium]